MIFTTGKAGAQLQTQFQQWRKAQGTKLVGVDMKKLFYDFDFEKSTVTITGSLLSAGRRLYAHPTGRATFLP